MKQILTILLFLSLSIQSFSKGCSNEYYIKGKAKLENLLIKNQNLTVTIGKNSFIITTDSKGNFEIPIKWISACPSRITDEEHKKQNEKLNPSKIKINFGKHIIEIDNKWKKYSKCFFENKSEVTYRKNLTFKK
tara:strand:- start:52 stop:453 length:402 start_codon:yes stop_codon:yes gene_type:complete